MHKQYSTVQCKYGIVCSLSITVTCLCAKFVCLRKGAQQEKNDDDSDEDDNSNSIQCTILNGTHAVLNDAKIYTHTHTHSERDTHKNERERSEMRAIKHVEVIHIQNENGT